MRTTKYTTKKGLSRIITRNYANWAEVTLCEDKEGYYLLGHAKKQFPSSNTDKQLIIVKFPYQTGKEIFSLLQEINILPEKNIIRLF